MSTNDRARKRQGNVPNPDFRAELQALSHEDPAELAVRLGEWRAHYRPQTPTENLLVEMAVRATLLHDRCVQFENAIVNQQIRDAYREYDAKHNQPGEKFRRMVEADTGQAEGNDANPVPVPCRSSRLDRFFSQDSAASRPEEQPEPVEEDPERARAADRALMIKDPKLMNIYLRHEEAATNALLRAIGALDKIRRAREKAKHQADRKGPRP